LFSFVSKHQHKTTTAAAAAFLFKRLKTIHQQNKQKREQPNTLCATYTVRAVLNDNNNNNNNSDTNKRELRINHNKQIVLQNTV
jgi:hypothetical protein